MVPKTAYLERPYYFNSIHIGPFHHKIPLKLALNGQGVSDLPNLCNCHSVSAARFGVGQPSPFD